ncbi:hypothetical protein [Roseateles sp.]
MVLDSSKDLQPRLQVQLLERALAGMLVHTVELSAPWLVRLLVWVCI